MAAVHWKYNEAEYRHRHKVYVDKTGQLENLYDFLSDILPSAIANMGYEVSQQSQINILSVGSGNGETDIKILNLIKSAVGPVMLFNRAIEPNDSFLKNYKRTIENLPDEELSKEAFDIYPPRTFEEYVAEPKGDVKFDIVHFSHSLYYIDVEEALVHCYNEELREKGMMITCTTGPKNLMCLIQKQDKSLGPTALERVSSVIQKYSWKYEEHTKEDYFDVSDVFDESSEEGNALLDFFTFTVDFRSSNTPDDVQRFLDLIKKYSVSRDGKYFANYEQKIIIIYK